jgi:hypothetical protein
MPTMNLPFEDKERLLKLINAEKLVNTHLGIETLEPRGNDRLDFHDVSVTSIMSLTLAVLNELNKELSNDTLTTLVHKSLWDADQGGIFTRNRDQLDFHDVSVFGIKRYLLDLVDCENEGIGAIEYTSTY